MSALTGLKLVETDVRLIKDYLEANMPSALQLQSTLHLTDIPNTALNNISEYFIYMKAQGFRTPCVFIIPERFDFKKFERGQNHINGEARVNISVLIEDKDAERLYLKAYRYQAAMVGLLDQLQLTSADGKVKIIVVVSSAQFSPLYSNTTDPTAPQSVFRKEVWIECEVEHFEALS